MQIPKYFSKSRWQADEFSISFIKSAKYARVGKSKQTLSFITRTHQNHSKNISNNNNNNNNNNNSSNLNSTGNQEYQHWIVY